jgi:hypothetical protein
VARTSDRIVAHRLMEGPVDHFVKLDRLPEDFQVPPQFQNRLEFDPRAQKLIFHGYMSKSEFDHISALTNDWRFCRTLEDLFRMCIPESPSKPNGLSHVLATFGQLFAKK